MLDENRLYRQTAVQEGDTGLAKVLDELERVLIDVAHSPQTVSPARFKTIRQRIDDDGLLFKVRVLAKQIQEQQTGGAHQPAQGGSAGLKDLQVERNEGMSKVKTIRWVQFASGAAAALLILPAAGTACAIAVFAQQADATQSSQQDQDNQNGNQNANEREEREHDRQEAERERQQEAKDREQEARDRVQERVDRLEEIYDDGRSALDDEKYERARDKFTEVIEANGPQADAALYWKAYAQQHLGQRDAALSSIADLKKRFPQSRWQKDASALEIEIRQGTGHPSRPEIRRR